MQKYKSVINIRLTSNVAEKLKEYAEEQEMSMSDVVRDLLTERFATSKV